MKVYLVTTGNGEDGNAWQVESIQLTREAAEKWRDDYNRHRPHWAAINNDIEEWDADLPFDPASYPHDPKKAEAA